MEGCKDKHARFICTGNRESSDGILCQRPCKAVKKKRGAKLTGSGMSPPDPLKSQDVSRFSQHQLSYFTALDDHILIAQAKIHHCRLGAQ